MRSIITSIVALLSTAFAVVPTMAQIPWNNDLQAAHAQAKQEGKRLLMHFYTDDCIYCERLEAGAFQSPTLAAAIEKSFVPVKIHAAMNPKIAKTFRVTRFPTDVIVTTDGTVLSHGVSPQDPGKFARLLAEHAPQTAPQTALAQARAPQPSPAPAAITQPATEKQPQTPTNTFAAMPGAATPTSNPHASSASADQPSQQVPNEAGLSLPTNLGGPSANVAAYRPQNNPLASSEFYQPPADTPPVDHTESAPEMTGSAAESDRLTIGLERSTQAGFTPSDIADAQPASDEYASDEQVSDEQAKRETPPVALQGFCPVALLEKSEWVAGDPAFGSIHLGQLYLFADQASLATFLADPEPYTPVMNGNDVVLFFEEHRVVEGRRDWGLVDPEFNRIFLFATEETMNHFYDHHQDYVRSAITVTRQAAVEANSKRR